MNGDLIGPLTGKSNNQKEAEMKTHRYFWSILFLVCVGLGPQMALGDGGGLEPPAGGCETLPPPTHFNPLISGTYTVAYDKSPAAIEDPTRYGHYNVHFALEASYLKGGKEIIRKMLFSFPVEIKIDKHLCDYTVEHFTKKYQYTACNKKIGKEFGFDGLPVLTDVTIDLRDRRPIRTDSMISGTLKIRVVP